MFNDILQSAFVLIAIYSLASISGLFAERSGTINLSINGGMIIGALSYFLMAHSMLHNDPNQPIWMQQELTIGVLITSILIGMIGSMVITSLLSFGAINLKGDQVVIGTAINILAPVISLIVVLSVFKKDHIETTGQFRAFATLGSQSLLEPWMIGLFLMLAVLGLVGILWLVLNKTKLGLRMRAAGENPNALAASGVSVLWTRHIGMLFSGALAGMAGALMAAFGPNMSSYNHNVSGMGFIALAILIIGQWRIPFVVIGALVISFLFALVEYYGVQLSENQYLLKLVPYVGTIAILPFVAKFTRAPKAAGIPYDKSQR